MIRHSLLPASLLAFVLTGCGATSPPMTTSSASLGARTLPVINPPPYIPGPLNGESTKRDLAIRRPLAVVIENFAPDSRPQSGLAAASTVIETLAESGITRFMALYLEHDAAKVGPVRSTRMYFDHWGAGLHSILVHVGGNDDAISLLWHLPKVFNVDENRWEEKGTYRPLTPLFWRSGDRRLEHTMYTSTYKVRAYAAKNGQNWPYVQASFPHKEPAPVSHRGHAGSIEIGWRNPLDPQPNSDYAVRYQYVRASNTYTRFMGGPAHIDPNTGKALTPSNVVIMRTKDASADPNAGKTFQSILIPTLGTGRAWYFHDGKVQKGTWKQANQDAPLLFLDNRGRPVAFNPGQTWIEAVPASSTVSWQSR